MAAILYGNESSVTSVM